MNEAEVIEFFDSNVPEKRSMFGKLLACDVDLAAYLGADYTAISKHVSYSKLLYTLIATLKEKEYLEARCLVLEEAIASGDLVFPDMIRKLPKKQPWPWS